ncbi:class I SAM-dependent methyltransferase [Candidatus Saccharibacteria bacterium]|nr:class I SAM-dependent methyltransferase [Candidatus Saccharibacteria bacterium]
MTEAKTKKKQPQNPDHEILADYNGYDYKKIFWEDGKRDYEDLADRLAVRKLLPEAMDDFVDIAGGYGRLADEYIPRAKHSTIFDYSKTELADAKKKYGDKIMTKQGDIYDLPFEDESFDGLMMVRATHHFKDMPKVIEELYRILKPGGVAVIEIASKKTLPKMLRYWFKKSDVNPFSKDPSFLKDLSMYNYHPKYMEDLFKKQGIKILKVLSVSNFRSPKLKKIFGTKFLGKLENVSQRPLALVRFAPSIYYKLEKPIKDAK